MKATSIYHHTPDPNLVKQVRAAWDLQLQVDQEYVVKRIDDPDFRTFVNLVGLQPNRIFSLWFISEAFLSYWAEAPTKDTLPRMAFVCYMNGLDVDDARQICLVWMRLHGRWIGARDETYLDQMLRRVWKDVQGELKKKKQRKVERQKARRAEMKRGRPVQTNDDCLRLRIIDVLKKDGKATPAEVAVKVEGNVHTVTSQLRRMVESGACTKPARGVYELAQATETTAEPAQAELEPEPTPEPVAVPITLQAEVERIKRNLKPNLEGFERRRILRDEHQKVAQKVQAAGGYFTTSFSQFEAMVNA